MANIKRRMKRGQGKNRIDFYVSAWCENGDLSVVVFKGPCLSKTGVLNTGLPDCDMAWLAEKVVTRIEQSSCKNQEQALCLADLVIQEQKPALLALAYPCNEASVGKRQCAVLH